MRLFKKENHRSKQTVVTSNTVTSDTPSWKKHPTIISSIQNCQKNNSNLYSSNNNNTFNKNKKNVNGVAKIQNGPAYHWQSDGAKKTSVDDMVLLTKISEAAITENLRKRLMEDLIYTYIGPVLVAVNPFKQLAYFGEKEIQMYQGAAQYEVPPHVYALADNMYRNMLIDSDSQCVIISGESGAGKTVSAKYIMNYMTRVSGGGPRVQKVKEIILESNPLLEAFGNAKTIRNNNSSRFGKYIEIEFSRGGEPLGGKISNFLLEKSRVHFLNEGERNFHIFYQICSGASEEMKSELGITTPDYYRYLSQSGVYNVEGTNDSQEFQDTLKAMQVMYIDSTTQMDILKVVAAILHMGNISFVENGNHGQIQDPSFLEFPAYLLGISTEALNQKLTSRVFDSKWGSVSERLDLTLNCEQAQFARDAWAKGLYARLFDYIVETVNKAMVTDSKEMNLGILDIYGFEIFGRNGFEQFCINYVNEKLQQIFIELTLKSEQEEYKEEGIHWKPIDFFNNKVVCDLIESKRPPGIFSILDDTCATMSAVSEGADDDFRNKLVSQIGNNPHYQPFKEGFIVKHYAGKVSYHIEGFCEKNRDVLFVDMIEVMQSSSNAFIRSLFSEKISSTKGRPSTSATKIKTQANTLVTKLSACVPHYIRCIKPNETKKPKDWDDTMVKNQVEYLGLKENIKVKRAGFAYRRPFDKFLSRYAIISRETWPIWTGDPRQGIAIIMKVVNMDSSQYQLGISKCFIKDPESLYMLEDYRERKFDHHARVLQKAFRKYFSKQRYMKEKLEACEVLLNKKERRSNSINRNFYGDYIGVDFKTGINKLVPKREKVEFSQTVNKYDRRFKSCKRDLILTKNALYLIGREKITKGPQKGETIEVIKRKLELDNIMQVTLSTLQDNFVLLHVRNDYESLLEIPFKTEFVMVLNRKLIEATSRELPRNFVNSFDYKVKKTRFERGGTRKVEFREGTSREAILQPSGSTLQVKIAKGLPAGARPSRRIITPEVRMYLVQHVQTLGRKSQGPGMKGPDHHRPQMAPPVFNNQSNHMPQTPQFNNSAGAPPAANVLRLPQKQVKQHAGNSIQRPAAPFSLNNQPVLLPKANQRWPPNAQQGSHVVPPPPNLPAPADQPVVGRTSPRPPIMTKPKPKVNQARALYSYDARDVDELTLQEGQILEVIKADDSGWWFCRDNQKEGFCPGNYLEKI